MTKNIIKIKSIFIANMFIILIFGCKSDVKDEKISISEEKEIFNTGKITNTNNLNISILLDLSDRISPKKYPNEAMEFYKRDVGYIKTISEVFLDNLSQKKISQANEKIELYFEPTPLNTDINKLSNNLKFHITKNNLTKEIIGEVKASYSSNPDSIYNLAIKDNKYVGSDTWRFFKNKVTDYCISEKQRDILIILSDGYIYHKDTKLIEGNRSSYLTPQLIRKNKLNTSSWQEKFESEDFGFIKVDVDLSNLEILVLGINPDSKNVYEEDVINEYWNKWFTDMKVKRFAIKQTDLPANLDKVIRDFINN